MVRRVVIHPSWTQVGMTNASYLFNAFQSSNTGYQCMRIDAAVSPGYLTVA